MTSVEHGAGLRRSAVSGRQVAARAHAVW